FDYFDAASNDCGFPDPEYYELFKRAVHHPRAHVIAYTAFEHVWSRSKGVGTGSAVIKPIGLRLASDVPSLVPSSVDRATTVFVPPYHNDNRLLDLAGRCNDLGIKAFTGRYGGHQDLVGFKAVVHIPYAWSNLALFEHLQDQLPVMVPSRRFLFELKTTGDFWWQQGHLLRQYVKLSEWYCSENDFLVYFGSWADLRRKLDRLDLDLLRRRMKDRAQSHATAVLGAWHEVFAKIEAAK
ncbi:MAG TPA: hypothetical protein VME46_09200, partial [Acidimicrobiales bacterium]|nr:hypothetical protein [Acidimicrobiales bacterium]